MPTDGSIADGSFGKVKASSGPRFPNQPAGAAFGVWMFNYKPVRSQL
jgi:hypothetical protein